MNPSPEKNKEKKKKEAFTFLHKICLGILLSFLVLQVFISHPFQIKARINVHESIETLEDLSKLQAAMANLEFSKTILHGIPEGLLSYDPTEGPDLNAFEENHNELKEISATFPDEFDFFCALDPTQKDVFSQMESCLEAGAIGFKMYIGNSYSHSLPLDHPSFTPVFTQIETLHLPLMLPVNTDRYAQEFENMMNTHPNLILICPHYCLSLDNLNKLSSWMDAYPNLYTDTSFGYIDFVREGMETISTNQEEFKMFFESYQDRILFATNTVITEFQGKDADWLTRLYSDYLSILTEDDFESEVDTGVIYSGLSLPYIIQRKVFLKNWESLLN
jgi:hypothetical protein